MSNVMVSYLICTLPRSGSGLICDLLWHTNLAGQPDEYFLNGINHPEYLAKWNVESLDDYIKSMLGKTMNANSVFGAKVMWDQLEGLLQHLKQKQEYNGKTDHQILSSIFPNLKYIRLIRTNKIRQSISFYQWKKTRVYSKRSNKGQNHGYLVHADLNQVACIEKWIREEEGKWEEYFKKHALNPLVVSYEQFIKSQKRTTQKLLQYLGITVPLDFHMPKTTYRKQSDLISEEIYYRYLAWRDHSAMHTCCAKAILIYRIVSGFIFKSINFLIKRP